jgi:hypothetical protein
VINKPPKMRSTSIGILSALIAKLIISTGSVDDLYFIDGFYLKE